MRPDITLVLALTLPVLTAWRVTVDQE